MKQMKLILEQLEFFKVIDSQGNVIAKPEMSICNNEISRELSRRKVSDYNAAVRKVFLPDSNAFWSRVRSKKTDPNEIIACQDVYNEFVDQTINYAMFFPWGNGQELIEPNNYADILLKRSSPYSEDEINSSIRHKEALELVIFDCDTAWWQNHNCVVVGPDEYSLKSKSRATFFLEKIRDAINDGAIFYMK